jgi:hypothetical protein
MRDPHPDRVEWPPTRLDVFSIAALAVVVYAAIEREWIMVGVALFATLVAVVLPKLRGPFELTGPIKFKGELIDPQAPRLRGVVDDASQRQLETGQPTPPLPPAPPERKRPHSG